MNAIDASRRLLRKESKVLAVRSRILALHADLLLVDDRLPLLNALRESALQDYTLQLNERSRCIEFHGAATKVGNAAITLLDGLMDNRKVSVHLLVQCCYLYSLPDFFSGDGQLASLMLEAIRLRLSKLKKSHYPSEKALFDCRCILQTPWFSPYL